jgi:uncharacterized protein (UPF0276 family)
VATTSLSNRTLPDTAGVGLRLPHLAEVVATRPAVGWLEFLNALVDRTGCQLLCDVSNVYLSGHNMGSDPYSFIDGLPVASISELHLGGFTPEEDEANPGATVLVDTHASTIAEPVWDLYAHALRRFGRTPTIIEWDNEIPPLATLLGEAARADRVGAQALEVSRAGAS